MVNQSSTRPVCMEVEPTDLDRRCRRQGWFGVRWHMHVMGALVSPLLLVWSLNFGFVEALQGFVAAAQERGVLKVTVNNANNGGLLSAIDGLPAFLPFSLVSKRVGTTYISLEVCLPT